MGTIKMGARGWGACFIMSLAMGCGGAEASETAASGGSAAEGSSASGGSAPASGGGANASGGSANSTGGTGQNATGGTGGGSSVSSDGLLPDYGSPSRRADLPLTRVSDCTGQPDMTLCEVATTPDRSYDICVAEACVSPGCGDVTCNASMPHFVIPPTSDHSYFERTGESEALVADLITGLEWQGCNAGLSGGDCGTGTASELNWANALTYCDELSWGGHEDWYLPDFFEAMSIMDYDVAERSSVDPSVFPASSSNFWTSQHAGSDDVYVASTYLGVGSGAVWKDAEADLHEVRCVRRAASGAGVVAVDRFEVSTSGDRTVKDRVTGLVWQGCVAGQSGEDCRGAGTALAAADFLAHCQELEYAGYSDWRLPQFKEAQSALTVGSRPFFPEEIADHLFSDYVSSWYGNEALTPVLLSSWDADHTSPNTLGFYDVLCVRNE